MKSSHARLALLLALAGCASPAPQGPVASAPTPLSGAVPAVGATATPVAVAPLMSSVTGPVDGLYRGEMELTQDSSPPCPGGAQGSLEIGDRKLWFPYTTDVIFIAPIAPDGKVHASDGGYVLDGTMTDGVLSVSIAGQGDAGCRSVLSFHRLNAF